MLDRFIETALLLVALWAAFEDRHDFAAWLVAIACYIRIGRTQEKGNG